MERKLLSSLLDELSAKDKGSYFLVRCPKCGEFEGFLYKDQFKAIQEGKSHRILIHCSRLNHCGETSTFENIYWDDATAKRTDVSVDESNHYPAKEAVAKITALVNLNYCLHDYERFTPWRGISKETLIQNGICYLAQKSFPYGWMSWMNLSPDYYPKDVLKSKILYSCRDIVIPFVNEDGEVDRVLLRSSWKKLNPKYKEITFKLTPKSIPIWNRKDAIAEGDFLFITEGVVDALSIKEVRPSANVVALPGVGQWKHFVRYITSIHLNKKVVICFDADKAGCNARNGLRSSLKSLHIKSEVFDLCGYGDLNDFLVGNRALLKECVDKVYQPRKRILLNLN